MPSTKPEQLFEKPETTSESLNGKLLKSTCSIYNPYLLHCLTRIYSARRAKMKQAEVKNVSRSARGLGRHG